MAELYRQAELGECGKTQWVVRDKQAEHDAKAWRMVRAMLTGKLDAKDVRNWAWGLNERTWGLLPKLLQIIADILVDEQTTGLREGLVKAWDGDGVERNVVCGHPVSAIVSGEEGTTYCSMCEAEAKATRRSMNNPTVKEIVAWWLRRHGYDGLAGEHCGCKLGDLMPCVEISADCIAGYRVNCFECKLRDTDECVGEPGPDDFCIMESK